MRKSTHSGEYAALRQRLEAMRKRAGLSQRALARRLGVPHTWVSKVETGERRIDLVEFAWYCAGCGVNAAREAEAIIAKWRLRNGSSEVGTPRGRRR